MLYRLVEATQRVNKKYAVGGKPFSGLTLSLA